MLLSLLDTAFIKPVLFAVQYDYPTIVMAASFRNVGEIRQLAG